MLLSMWMAGIFSRNSYRKLAQWIANAQDNQGMLWTGSNLSILSGKQTREWALTFFPRTLLTPLPLEPLAVNFSRHPINGDFARRLLRFSLLWEMVHHDHNGSVNSKHTHTPKSICQVLTSPLALDIWGRADKIAQTLVLAKLVDSNLFCEIWYLQLSEQIAPFLGKKKRPSKLKSIPASSWNVENASPWFCVML